MRNHLYAISLALSFLILTCITSLAQGSFQNGYIVINNGDTLRGAIDYNITRKGKHRLIKLIDNAGSDKELRHDLVQLVYFNETNENFYNRVVDLDKKSIQTNKLQSNSAKLIERDTVLLKLLVDGNVRLYQYMDENGKEHFLYEKDGVALELNYIRYYMPATTNPEEGAAKDQVASTTIREFKEYKQQLANLTRDCSALQLKSASLTEKSLIKFFSKYNSCSKNLTYVYKNKVKTSVSAMLGLANSHFKYAGNDEYNNSLFVTNLTTAGTYRYKPVNDLLFGINMKFKKAIQSKYLGLNIVYQAGNYLHAGGADGYDSKTTKDFYFKFGNLTTMVDYNFRLYKYSPRVSQYFSAGIGINYLLSNDNYMKMVVEYPTRVVESKIQPIVLMNKIGYAYSFATSTELKKFCVKLGIRGLYYLPTRVKASAFSFSPFIAIQYTLKD